MFWIMDLSKRKRNFSLLFLQILSLETVNTENLILSEKVATLKETNEKSRKKIELLETRIEDQSSKKSSIDFEAQYPSEGISSISLTDEAVVPSKGPGKECKQIDAIVTDEKPPVTIITEIKEQKGARTSYTRPHVSEMKTTLAEGLKEVKDEPDLMEIKDKNGTGIMEIKENRKRSIREMEERSNISNDVLMKDISKETVVEERRIPFRESVI